MIWLFFSSIAVFILAYMVIRPTLAALPQLKAFYAEADTIWQKIFALAWRKASVAWSYLLFVVGWLVNQLDTVAGLVGDPDFREQIANALGADPKLLSYVMIGISLLIFINRMKAVSRSASDA